MRLIVSILTLTFLASCGLTTTDNGVSSGQKTRSLITNETYDASLQKTIPSPVFGTGKHNITIYADFQCPACIAFSDALGAAFESYAASGMTSLTFKQFPLTSIHANAYRDAIAGLCAAEQGEYMTAKKALYNLEKEKSGAKVTDAERIRALVAAGSDEATLTQCLADSRYAKQVDDEVIEGTKLGISGTPTVLLDGKRMDLGAIFADPTKGQAFLDRVLGE